MGDAAMMVELGDLNDMLSDLGFRTIDESSIKGKSEQKIRKSGMFKGASISLLRVRVYLLQNACACVSADDDKGI